jgi:hypothetical protein
VIRPLGCAVAVAVALVAAGSATAGPFVGKASKTRARAGDVVRVQAGAGLRFYALLPLYLVRRDLTPQPKPCTVNGHDGICEARAPRPPRGGIYHRIGTVNVRHSNVSTITYRVPNLQPGVYAYVMYCGPCYAGAGGSVIAFDQGSSAALTVVR